MYSLSKQIFDNKAKCLRFKTIMFKQEVLEMLLYACATWTTTAETFRQMSSHHYRFLNRITGHRKRPKVKGAAKNEYADRMSYAEVLELTKCECIEATIRKRRLRYAGELARMKSSRLQLQLLLGEVEGGKRKAGRGTKDWTQCLREDLNKFKIPATTWISTAQSEKAWLKEIDEGTSRFMSDWKRSRKTKH